MRDSPPHNDNKLRIRATDGALSAKDFIVCRMQFSLVCLHLKICMYCFMGNGLIKTF